MGVGNTTLRRGLIVAATVLLVGTALNAAAGVGLAQQTENEPNNDTESATQIEPNVTVTGEVAAGGYDYFSFRAEAGQAITLDITGGDDIEEELSVEIRDTLSLPPDPPGTFTFVEAGESVRIGQTARGSGRFYVVVSGSGSYSFTLNVSKQEAKYEPNEVRGAATRIELGTTVTGEITVGDDDYFSVPVTAGQTVTVDITGGDDIEGGLFVGLISNSSDESYYVEATTLRAGESLRLGGAAEVSGPFYIRITAIEGGHTGSYSFTVSVTGERQGGQPARTPSTMSTSTTDGTATTNSAAAADTTNRKTTTDGPKNGSSGVFGPGFSVVGVVVAFLVTTLLAVYRR